MKDQDHALPVITPDDLFQRVGYSPADNNEGFTTYVPWVSRLVGGQVRTCFQWKNYLDSLTRDPLAAGPAAFFAAAQRDFIETWITGPIRSHAKESTKLGNNPDIFVESDEVIEEKYAALLKSFCGLFIRNGKFDHGVIREITTGDRGEALLKEKVGEFAVLEQRYNAMGLTRLTALKELLKSLVMVVTRQVFTSYEALPFVKKGGGAMDALNIEGYLELAEKRLENLYNHDAFHLKSYAVRFTGGEIGLCRHEVVEGSRLHSVTLRHYPLPEETPPNGKVLYLSSPLINKPEIYDLAEGKSVVQQMLREGFALYLVDPGNPGPDEALLGLDFYGKTVHDHYLALIKERHPNAEIFAMGYCMGGTLFLPYLARRAQERLALGKPMDIKKVALMASPFRFDDDKSGHGPMRGTIKKDYDTVLMEEMYGDVNVPPQIIEVGMNEIQPGVRYNVASGFYGRAGFDGAIADAAPFLYWLTHGTRFPARAHSQWINRIFMGNEIERGLYPLPSSLPHLDDKPVDMGALKSSGVFIFDYRGKRDPISPVGSCVAGELWGQTPGGNRSELKGGLNRTIEKNIGHIFVVSKKLLAEYIESVTAFFRADEAPCPQLMPDKESHKAPGKNPDTESLKN